jgi:hypothetical protein
MRSAIPGVDRGREVHEGIAPVGDGHLLDVGVPDDVARGEARRLYDPLTDSCEDSRTAHRLLRYWKKAPPLSRRGFFHVPLALPFRRRPCFDLGKARDANSNTGRRAAEAKFPYRIDIPVPVGGLGNRLTEMLMWCRENIPAGAWA